MSLPFCGIAFYKYFINDLYAYGRSLGAEEKYVMDAVQDVFLKVFFACFET